jgi:MtfA peptidase
MLTLSHWIIIVLFFLFLAFIAWQGWLKNKIRKHRHFSEEWRAILLDKVSFYEQLPEEDRGRFEQEILYFLNKVSVTGVEIELEDADRLLVAASAVIPLFGFSQLRYRNIDEVLLYKGNFNADNQTEGKKRNIMGKVGSGDMNRLMILSLPALRQGFENEKSKSNVGIHEFVHLIDKADGATDGIPESLMQKQYVIPWLKLVHREIGKIKGNDSDINPYGATNEVEFFSVVSEYFFNQPDLFQKEHPDLYALMTKIYRQEPG